MGFLALFGSVLAWLSMLFSVKFHVAKREVRMLLVLAALREREFQKKKAISPLYPLLPLLGG